ncbi:HAMP domain-containing protein [Rhodobacterales bacterium HKCCE4037]|nr:HAMP domain-containing protein [Rhodobacterales bacterium HKCCE4037]
MLNSHKLRAAFDVESSLFKRAAVLSALTTLAVVVLAIAFSVWQSGRVARDGVRALAHAALESTAIDLAPHVRFGNPDAVAETLENHAEVGDDQFVSIAVWDATSAMMGNVGEPASAAMIALRDAVMQTGEMARSRNGYTVAEPIIFDAAQGPIGVTVTTWSPRATLNMLMFQTILGTLFLAGIFAAATWYSVRRLSESIGDPIKAAEQAMDRVANGDYDTPIAEVERRDELGGIARSLETLRGRLQEARHDEAARDEARKQQAHVVDRLASALQTLAEGDLTHRIDEDLTGGYNRLRADFNSAVSRLAEAISQVAGSVGSVEAGSQAISSGSDDLSARTEQQAATLEETAAAIAELTTSVQETASGARDVESAMLEARKTSEESGQIVESAQKAMSDIETSSQQVAQIIGIIDEIAFQTNLLALNAGVEAARAGDAGRGFAVVASEVRDLAQRASDAAQQIKGLIEQSNTQVKGGVSLVERTGVALAEISQKVSLVSERISSIAQGAVDQAHGLSEINQAVASLDRVTQQNAAMVEETNAAAHALRGDTVRITELMAQFNVGPHTAKARSARAA